MPGFDGTGPRGQGPFTGRAMGYCAVPLSRIAPAGRSSAPLAYPYYPTAAPYVGAPAYGHMRIVHPGFWRRPWFGGGRGLGRRRGRRRW